MKDIELLISKLEKDVGPIKETPANDDRGIGYYSFEFIHNEITLKILLIEAEPDNWVIHHELTKENPLLLKKIAGICERIQRIKEGKKVSFSLSEDLQEIIRQSFLHTAIKSCIQNFLMKFSLFKDTEEKFLNVYNKGMDVTINAERTNYLNF